MRIFYVVSRLTLYMLFFFVILFISPFFEQISWRNINNKKLDALYKWEIC